MRGKELFHYKKGSWIFLFHALILLLALYPYFETPAEERHPWLLVLMNSVIVLAIIHAASWKHPHFIIALLLGTPTLIAYWFPQLPFEKELSLFCTVILYFYAIMLILRSLLRAHDVGCRHSSTLAVEWLPTLFILLLTSMLS